MADLYRKLWERQLVCLPQLVKRVCVPLSNPIVVLCVDDEPTILMARRLILSIAGYQVLTAGNGDTALDLFRRHPVEMVITDHFLPDLTGAEIAAEMKRLRPEVPIVMLTGYAEVPEASGCVDLVLIKGMQPPDFLDAVAKLAPRH